MGPRTRIAGVVSALIAVVLAPGVAVAGSPTVEGTGPVPNAAVGAADPPPKRLPALVPGTGRLWDRLQAGELSEAAYAVEAARRALASRPTVARADGGRTGAGELSMLLRDVAVRWPALGVEGRAQARRLLARPTEGAADPRGHGYRVPAEVACSSNVCVHWVGSTVDAPPAGDSDGDAIPDWVEVVAGELEFVWESVSDLGFRPPQSDETSADHGPDSRLDVYLKDLGGDDTFGYCATDDPAGEAGGWNLSAFCVLDNDFSTAQFDAPPLQSLRATAAHEFFHAVQFGYDAAEDFWMMETTATWVEEQVYPDANDNRQYLISSAIVAPRRPLDFARDGFEYGNWVFWQFLTEYLGDTSGPDPTVVRDVWRLADAAPGAADVHSTEAVRRVVAQRGLGFAQLFSRFAQANRIARAWYSDGSSYPQSPAVAAHALTRGSPAVRWHRQRLDHLSSAHVVFRPGRDLTGAGWRLLVDVDLPRRARGSAASVAVRYRDGRTRWWDLVLTSAGDAQTVRFPFSRASVASVELTLTNASIRYRCWQRTVLACSGLPLDDDLAHWYRARVRR
jgi:hypothetical protein